MTTRDSAVAAAWAADRRMTSPRRCPRRCARVAAVAASMCVVGLAAAIPAAGVAAAQTAAAPGAAGMDGAFHAVARGYQALYWNPANLALEDGPAVSVGVPHVAFTGTLLGSSIGDARTFISEELTDADRARLLDAIPSSGIGFRADVSVPIAGLGLGPVAFGVVTTLQTGMNVSRDLADLYLYTRQYGDIDYDRIAEYRVGDTGFRNALYTTFIGGYGHDLGGLAVGVAGRFVVGHELQRGRIFEPVVDLTDNHFAVPALAIRSTRGRGVGLDVGLAAQPLRGFTLGLSVQNLVQRMTWEDALELRGDDFTGTDLSEMTPTDLPDRLATEPFDSADAPSRALAVAENLFDESFFPRVFRVGASYDISYTTLAASFGTTLGTGDLHVGWPRYLTLGAEQRLPFISVLALRAATATSLDGASALTGGVSLRLGPVRINGGGSLVDGTQDTVADTRARLRDGGTRLADRLVAGSGAAAQIGIEILVH